MNKLLQKLAKLTLGLAMAAGVGVAVSAGKKDASPVHADTSSITITYDGFDEGPTYNSGAEYTGTFGGITVACKYVMLNGTSNMQLQANNANVYNKTATPGRITNITVKQTGTARAFEAFGGTSQLFSSSETGTGQSPSGTSLGSKTAANMSWDIASGTDYTFFAIHKGANAGYVTEIIVTYETSGGGGGGDTPTPSGSTFELIKSVNDLVVGSKYLIGIMDSSYSHDNVSGSYFVSTEKGKNENNRSTIKLTVDSNDCVTEETGLETFTLGKVSNQWTLYADNLDGFLCYTTGSNYLKANGDPNNGTESTAKLARWDISISNAGIATIVGVLTTSARGYMRFNPNYNSKDPTQLPLISCYASTQTLGSPSLSLFKKKVTEPSATISGDSISLFKGDSDSSLNLSISNLTATSHTVTFKDSGAQSYSASSTVIQSVTTTHSLGNNTVTVQSKGAGTTSVKITVTDGTTNLDVTFSVTVNPKPASMSIIHSDISEGELEIITGSYKQVSFSGLDTDSQAYAIAAGDVTPSAQSGSSHVTLSGSRITGASEGDAVVRYTLNALNTVYAEVTVHVVDDYIETVGAPSFASNLSDTQGQSPTVSVFTSRPGTMHSGVSTTVPFENYKFSYTENYSDASYGSVFSYDFSHGSTVDSTHKLQTIYVFSDIDEAAHGSFSVTITQLNDPLTAIAITNVSDHAKSITRGATFQLAIGYTPTNPTDGKEVVYSVDNVNGGDGVSVSSTGLISVSASSGLGTARVNVKSAHDASISDYVTVTVTLEEMTYVVSEPLSESFTQVTSVNDITDGEYLFVGYYETDDTYYYYDSSTGLDNQQTGTVIVSNGTITPTAALKASTFTIESMTGGYSFKNKAETSQYISASGVASGSNGTTKTNDPQANAFELNEDGVSFTISSNSHYLQMNPNKSGTNPPSPVFRYYKGSSASYTDLMLFKLESSGGNTPYNVTAALFNGIHNNFGSGKTYQWSDSCESFNSTAWLNACNALKGITNYSSYKLNRAVANENGNEVEQFLAKYDFIIRKASLNATDHLQRFASGGINYGSRPNVNPIINIIGNNTNTVAIIIVISMVSVGAIGGYFFIRKRKEN